MLLQKGTFVFGANDQFIFCIGANGEFIFCINANDQFILHKSIGALFGIGSNGAINCIDADFIYIFRLG